MKNSTQDRLRLPFIVIAQFFGTSVWFAGNAVSFKLIDTFHYEDSYLGYLTSSVQLGFIFGTLVFSLMSIADRFKPSTIFLLCAFASALVNGAIVFTAHVPWALLSLRFFTGIFLAGIYPVGMKIASDWYDGKLGVALGYLVGALVLGTALPHLLNTFDFIITDWRSVFMITSGLSVLAGLLIYFRVGDGPAHKKQQNFSLGEVFKAFKIKAFRRAALGYFGHMWELYAFWAFLPLLLQKASFLYSTNTSISLWSFIIIAIGGLGCILGGYQSLRIGSSKVAFRALSLSMIFCVLSTITLQLSFELYLISLLAWGFFVSPDSPQFSTLVARFAPVKSKGSALTIVNSIGFFISVISIELINFLNQSFKVEYLILILILGPLTGLFYIKKLVL